MPKSNLAQIHYQIDEMRWTMKICHQQILGVPTINYAETQHKYINLKSRNHFFGHQWDLNPDH